MKILLLVSTLWLCASSAYADLTVAQPFSSSMVLQHGTPVPIWGTGDVGEEVTVVFKDQSQTATVDPSGKWRVTLDTLSVESTPNTLKVSGPNAKIVVTDVVVGDVWLCSGQSNMGFALSKCRNGKAAAKTATDKGIRVNNYRDGWQPCVTDVAASSSGVAYFFARRLRDLKPNVPVGLIVRPMSGTPIEYWIPRIALNEIEFCQKNIERFAVGSDEEKKWTEFMLAEREWKKKYRKNGKDRKAAGPRPKFEGDTETQVLTEIYCAENPGRLWRDRIHPWSGFAIAGTIWYQGERNTKAGDDCAKNYGAMLKALIASWRKEWKQGDFRFLVVQLPTFEKGSRNWSVIQEQQAATANETANADYIDIRDLPVEGLHPSNKQPVGERLAEKAGK